MTDLPQLSRRSLFKAIGVGATAIAAPSLLTGCGSGAESVGNAGTEKVDWPTYRPFAGPAADLPGTAEGVQSAFLKYPSNLVNAVNAKPGDGSTVKIVLITYGTPPTPVEQNKLWQAVNAATGVNIELIIVPDADYIAKMSTLMTSDDLPDIICIGGGYSSSGLLPREKEFVAAKCADLSEYLSGDKIKAYPSLANIPTYAWTAMGRIKGRIYGVPIERAKPGGCLMVNRQAFTAVGADDTTWGKTDFAAAAKALSKDKHYGLGASKSGNFGTSVHAAAFGAPAEWGVDGGRFVRTITTPQFKEALAFMRELHAAGAYSPDTMSTSQVDMKTLYYNGTLRSMTDGFGGYSAAVTSVKDAFTVDLALPYTTGAATTHWASAGLFGYTVLKKAPAERIKMLLGVLDLLAAPFGTKEYELLHFGVEGTHFTRDAAGTPVPGPLWTGGENTTNLPFKYISDAPQVLYYPGVDSESIKRVHAWETALVPKMTANASAGLVSDTQSRNGAALTKNVNDALVAVVTGQASLDSWDDVVKKWRNDGGDKIAAEYAAEYAS